MAFLTILVAGFFLFNGCSGKAPQKVYRVGILSSLSQLHASIDGFKEKMAELGYIEGKNIIYDTHKTNPDPVTSKQVLNKFVADKVDLIFVSPTETALVAKAATKGTNIPVVFANAFLEGNNLVESVRQPGGNITGVRFPGPEYAAKRLEMLHEIMPQAKRIWITYDPNNPNNPPTLEVLRFLASSIGVTLVEVPVASVAEIQADLERRDKSGDINMDAIMFIPDWLVVSPDSIAVVDKFTAAHKMPVTNPAIGPRDHASTILGYTSDPFEVGKLAAVIADKIFRGTPAGRIPVVSPEARLQINYKKAQELGLTVPEGLLSRADEIIR